MATPRKKKAKGGGEGAGGDDRDPIKRLIGSPEPSLRYMEGVLGRLFTPGVVAVVVVALALYFWYGP